MEINIQGLRTIVSALRGSEDFQDRLVSLRELVCEKGDFSFDLSPLALLKNYPRKGSWKECGKSLNEVFAVLKTSPDSN